MKTENPSCRTCAFWYITPDLQPGGIRVGHCKAVPPIPVAIGHIAVKSGETRPMGFGSAFPLLPETEFCGLHKVLDSDSTAL
jgi:hypothetical protein